MATEFQYDVFLSHSAKDKPVVREIVERLREAELRSWFHEWVLKPGDNISAKIGPPSHEGYGGTGERLEHSRMPACPGAARRRRRMLCMPANTFGSDWAQSVCAIVASRQE